MSSLVPLYLHSFNKYLSIYHGPGIVQSADDAVIN